MSRYSSHAVEVLVEELSHLPGIGKKTAQRLALHLLRAPKQDVERLIEAISQAKEKVIYCSTCQNHTDATQDPCTICSSQKRNHRILCVVESPADVIALEKTNQYNGMYHVLHGVISPLDGIGPNDIKIKELLHRCAAPEPGVNEVVLALSPTVEGETTVLYLSKMIKPFGIKVSRIARGIPIGSELEFVDEATLTRALEGRAEV